MGANKYGMNDGQQTRQAIEEKFGSSGDLISSSELNRMMDGVKVHYNSDKPDQLKALAFAQGNDIHFGPGHEHHLPHEAWHVVQQRQGKVTP